MKHSGRRTLLLSLLVVGLAPSACIVAIVIAQTVTAISLMGTLGAFDLEVASILFRPFLAAAIAATSAAMALRAFRKNLGRAMVAWLLVGAVLAPMVFMGGHSTVWLPR
jgi:hypothetical protein